MRVAHSAAASSNCRQQAPCHHPPATPVLNLPSHPSCTTRPPPLPPQLDAHSFTRKNPNVKPFEAGGEAPLEFFCNKSNCSTFVLGSHSKKRPHNLTLGRLYEFHLYDCLELGVEHHRPIKAFKGAGTAQVGNKVGWLVGMGGQARESSALPQQPAAAVASGRAVAMQVFQWRQLCRGQALDMALPGSRVCIPVAAITASSCWEGFQTISSSRLVVAVGIR